MTVYNRRNAVIGWLVVKAGKRAAKRRAESVAPVARTGGAAAGVLAAVAGLLLLQRKKRSGAE
jgi:hypothetical protein